MHDEHDLAEREEDHRGDREGWGPSAGGRADVGAVEQVERVRAEAAEPDPDADAEERERDGQALDQWQLVAAAMRSDDERHD